jgi:GT2 family glycosyltransferase
MRCSVVIPCHNRADLTAACLESLRLQRGSVAIGEVLLVDNASTDETASLANETHGVHVLRQERNLGFAGGVNVGIRAARHELVLVLNNDTLAASNVLHELAAVLTSEPGMAAVAPVSNHVKGAAKLAIGDGGKPFAAREALAEQLARAARVQDATTLAGLCLLVRRRTFDEVGAFDERFGHGNFEDDDFCLRLRLRGHRLGIAGRAFLHHEGHATFKHLGLDLGNELERRRAQFVGKWRHDPAGAAYIAALRGDALAAATAARAARTAHPCWPDADWHLGIWCDARGNHAQAAEHFASLLRQCPHHADARIALVRSLLRNGDADQALTVASAVAEDAPSVPQHVQLLRVLGDHDYHRGAMREALAHFTAALELEPTNAALHNWVGACLLGAGDAAAAAVHFARAAETGEDIAWHNLGICRLRLGDVRAARECFATAVQRRPDHAEARQNLAACGGAP